MTDDDQRMVQDCQRMVQDGQLMARRLNDRLVQAWESGDTQTLRWLHGRLCRLEADAQRRNGGSERTVEPDVTTADTLSQRPEPPGAAQVQKMT